MGQNSSRFQEKNSFDAKLFYVVDRAVQTNSKSKTAVHWQNKEETVSFISKTQTKSIVRKIPSPKTNKTNEISTQTDKNDLKLRSRQIRPKRNGNFLCSCAKKQQKKWLILQNEENFMDYEPLSEILAKTQPKSPENSAKFHEKQSIFSKALEERSYEIPKFIEDPQLSYAELLRFVDEVDDKEFHAKDLEILEPLYEAKGEFFKEFRHFFRCLYENKFVLLKITEFDKIIPNKIEFEEELLRDILKEKFIYDTVFDLNEEKICRQLFFFQVKRKNLTPLHERTVAIVQIFEFGRCSLEDILHQRELKGEFYKEREIMRILSNLNEALYLLHSKKIAHENISPQSLLLSDYKKSYMFGNVGNACLISKSRVIVKKTQNIANNSYLAPEIYEHFPNFANIIYDPFIADVFSLGLVVLEMMGVKVADFSIFRGGNVAERRSFIENLKKKYPVLTRIVEKMLEKNPGDRITLKEIGRTLKQESQERSNEHEKILLVTAVLDQTNEIHYLKSHQNYINEISDELKLRKFEAKAYGDFLLGNTEKALQMYHELLEFRLKVEGNAYLRSLPILSLLDQIGCFYYYMRNYDLAVKYYEESYEAKKQFLSAENDEFLSFSCYFLALAHFQLDNYNIALSFIDKSVEILCGSEKDVRLDISRFLSWKGLMLSQLKRHNEAIKVFTFVVKLREEVFALEKAHYLICDSYSDLALEYFFLGEKKEAVEFYEKCLFMRKILYRTYHKEIVSCLNNLGALYDDLGDYNKALQYYQDALRILRILSPEDSEIAKILNNIAGIYQNKQDPESSHEFYEKSLQHFKQSFAATHPYMAKSLLGLGNNYFSKGNIEKSYQCYLQGVLILNRLDVEDFLDLARLKLGLGNCYRKLQYFELAVESYEKSLQLYEEFCAFKEREIADLFNNMGQCYVEQGKNVEALEILRKCLDIREKILPSNHIEIAYVLGSMALVFKRMGNRENWKKYWSLSHEIKRKIFGEKSGLVEMELLKYNKEILEEEEEEMLNFSENES